MNLEKIQIQQALATISIAGEGKNMIESGAITNIVIFGNEIIIDLTLSSPAMHIKKRAEDDIKNLLKQQFSDQIIVKINTKIQTPEANPNQIKGKAIPGINNIIAVASGKGGVGKSTVTANIAVTLAKMGFAVGILDADIYGPSMPIMFDVENQKPISITIDGKSKMKPVESYEIKILSIGFFTAPSQAVIWRGPMASKALNQMIFDAHWGELDFLLIDLPPGTGDIHLSIMQSLPITGAVVVSTPQNVALADAKKGVSMFLSDAINVPVLGIIENMAYFCTPENPTQKHYIFGQHGAKNLAEDLEIPFLGEVPLEQNIRESADYGRPAAMQTNSQTTTIFEQITRNIIQKTVARNHNLPATEAIKITTMAGCSAIKKT